MLLDSQGCVEGFPSAPESYTAACWRAAVVSDSRRLDWNVLALSLMGRSPASGSTLGALANAQSNNNQPLPGFISAGDSNIGGKHSWSAAPSFLRSAGKTGRTRCACVSRKFLGAVYLLMGSCVPSLKSPHFVSTFLLFCCFWLSLVFFIAADPLPRHSSCVNQRPGSKARGLQRQGIAIYPLDKSLTK